jgi:hypothetical protein
MFKAAIYTILATCFLAITIGMVVTGFERPGFNTAAMVSVSGGMTLIMSVASWIFWKNLGSQNITGVPRSTKTIGILRLGKVFIASYGVAIGAYILGIVIGMWLFGFEKVDNYISNYMGLTLLAITIATAPIVNKYLR